MFYYSLSNELIFRNQSGFRPEYSFKINLWTKLMKYKKVLKTD